MKRKITYSVFAVVGIMMTVYLTCDVFSLWDSRILKFITSAVVTAFGLIFIRKEESRFVCIALIFTLTADVFFVLVNKFIFGVAVFILVQLAYTAHFSYLSGKALWKEILKRILPGLAGGVIVLALGAQVKLAVTVLYACSIAVNFAHAIELYIQKRSKAQLILLLGFILLAVGDVCVGLRNLSSDFVTAGFAKVCYFITWLSYPPSQLLILASTGVLPLKKEKQD